MRWAGWTVAEREPHRVVMEHVLHPRPGYPFSLALAIEYRLSDGGPAGADDGHERWTASRVRTGAARIPYLTAGTPTWTRLILRAPGADGAAVGRARHPGRREIRRGHRLRLPPRRGRSATTRLDHCFTDLERDGDGLARVELRDADGGSGLTLWVDESYPYLMLFTGDPLPDVDRRSLAVEPMTCPPNAFRTGRDLIRLEPGHSVTTTWGIGPCCSSG